MARAINRSHYGSGSSSWLGGYTRGDSLVIALAIPLTTHAGAPFPARDLIVFVTCTVIFTTLVLQGLSLGSLLR
jgi:CPA1 family monovalent cation:H+ antiporter